MIGGYFVIGLGVALGLHIVLPETHRVDWNGYTMAAGLILLVLFWPVVIVALLTLILCRLADR